ncbi:MAG: hypothetical protein ACK4FA_01550 [Candidatus Paceibacteria bacterium]
MDAMELQNTINFGPIFIFILIFSGIALGIILQIKRKKMLKRFALEHGYNYLGSGSVESLPSLYLQVGHSRRVSHVISGSIEKHPVRFFDFRSIIGHGKHKRHVTFSVCELKYDANLRRFLILSRQMRFGPGNLYDGFQNGFGREIKMEGDFHKYFKVYVPEDYEIEVFQIFTPDIMVKFIDLAKGFTFEFVDDKILVYTRGLIYKKETMEKIHELARMLVSEFAQKIKRI